MRFVAYLHGRKSLGGQLLVHTFHATHCHGAGGLPGCRGPSPKFRGQFPESNLFGQWQPGSTEAPMLHIPTVWCSFHLLVNPVPICIILNFYIEEMKNMVSELAKPWRRVRNTGRCVKVLTLSTRNNRKEMESFRGGCCTRCTSWPLGSFLRIIWHADKPVAMISETAMW